MFRLGPPLLPLLLALPIPLLFAAGAAAAVGDQVVLELADGKSVRGVIVAEGPGYLVVDRGGTRGPFYDPVVRIERGRIVRVGDPDAPTAASRWVDVGWGASRLGGRAFTFEVHRALDEHRFSKVAWTYLNENEALGSSAAPLSPSPALAGVSPRDEWIMSLSYSRGRTGRWRAVRTTGSWGAALVGGQAQDGGFVSAGLVVGYRVSLRPDGGFGIGLGQHVNLNAELPYSAAFLTVELATGP